MQTYEIRIAQTRAEREQVHRLNYVTFVEEIPQHAPNPERRLVDRFDAENEYVIALAADGQVVGMLALRARPFAKIGLAVGEAVPAALATPDSLQDRVLGLRGNWR